MNPITYKENKEFKKKVLKELIKMILTKSDDSFRIRNKVLGEVILPYGTFGDIRISTSPKGGYGLEHIIQKRYEESKLSLNEICGICLAIVEGACIGSIISFNESKVIIEFNSISIIIKEKWNNVKKEWIVTGFPMLKNGKIKKEAMDTIHTVNAKYSYLPNYSSFRNQVGTIVSSINNIRQALNKIKNS